MLIDTSLRESPLVQYNPGFGFGFPVYQLKDDQLPPKWGHVFACLRKYQPGTEMFLSPLKDRICREAPIITILQHLFPNSQSELRFSAFEIQGHEIGHLCVHEKYITSLVSVASLYGLEKLASNCVRAIQSKSNSIPFVIFDIQPSRATILNFDLKTAELSPYASLFEKEVEIAKKIGQTCLAKIKRRALTQQDIEKRVSLFKKEVLSERKEPLGPIIAHPPSLIIRIAKWMLSCFSWGLRRVTNI